MYCFGTKTYHIFSILTYTLVMVWLVLAKRSDIQIFLVALRRFCAKKKWIWLFALTFFVTFFRQGKKRKIKTNTLPPKLPIAIGMQCFITKRKISHSTVYALIRTYAPLDFVCRKIALIILR